MAVMNISRLADLGYSGLDSRLEDPMDKRFRPQKYMSTNLEEVKSKVLPGFAALKAYPDPVALAEMEEKYWAGKELPKPDQTSAQVAGGIDPKNMDMMNSMHGSNGMSGMNGMGGSSESKSSNDMDMNCDENMMSSMHGGSASTGAKEMDGMKGMEDMKGMEGVKGMDGMKDMNGMKDMKGSNQGAMGSSSSSHNSHHGG
jgi:hypothetical protein